MASMGKILKIMFAFIATVVLFIVLAVFVLPIVIDPDDFKPEIQTAVQKATGRPLTIEGNLKVSVFPWIGLETGRMTLGNLSGFDGDYLVEIEQSHIKVKLLPLLSEHIEVSRLVLKGLKLNLVKNKEGAGNWENLIQTQQGPEKPKEESADQESNDVAQFNPATLALGGISIENAVLKWNDLQTGQNMELQDLNFVTSQLLFNQPIDIDFSVVMNAKDPLITETLKMSADLVVSESLQQIQLNHLNLFTKTQGNQLPGGQILADLSAGIVLDLDKQSLAINDLLLNSGNLRLEGQIQGQQIVDKPHFTARVSLPEFNLAQFLQTTGIELPQMQAKDALNRFSASLDIQAGTEALNLNNVLIHWDETTLKGQVKVNDLAAPQTGFGLTIDRIDLDRYLPPAEDQPKKTVTVATPGAVATEAATLFPVESLRSLNLKGQLDIGHLIVSRLKLDDVQFKLNAKNGLLETHQTIGKMYQGSYKGGLNLNVKQAKPKLSLDETLSGVRLEPLLADLSGSDRMSGIADLNVVLNTQGNTMPELKSGLNGQALFKFKDGTIRGFNLQNMIDNGKALIEGKPLPSENKKDQTVFSEISGTANIINGLVKNDDLYAEASKLRVNGKGTANLVSEQLDYNVKARLLKQEATATDPEKIKGYPLIFNIGGTFQKPEYQLDIKSILTEKNKAKIEKELKKLDEKIAPGVSDLLKKFL
jgi:AsmA protein